MDFSSLAIKRATIQQKEKDKYLVLQRGGERKIVAASSASDAVEISGYKDVKKVINLAFEFEQILEKGALADTDETFLTRTTLEEALTEFYTADLLDEKSDEVAFVECDMIEFASLNHVAPKDIPVMFEAEPEPAPPPPEATVTAQQVEAAEPPPAAPEAPEAKKQVEIIDAPVEHPLQETDKQLSQEEIEALLNPE